MKPGFLWGAATAAYQIEGAWNEAGKGASVWDMMCRIPGKIWSGQDGHVACDHMHRMEEDVSLMAEIGLNAYRFSVSWPRVLPQGVGKPNGAGLDFYDRLVDTLLEKQIEPCLTLFHWDYPYELFCRGGWLNADSPGWFADYAALMMARLSDRVRTWITFNEPQMFLALGHVAGTHAPGLRLGDQQMLRCCHHAFLGHGRAVQSMRAAAKQPVRIGLAPAGFVKIPRSDSSEDVGLARSAMFAVQDRGHFNNAWYMDPMLLGRYPEDGVALFGDDMPERYQDDMSVMCQPLDFLGINIYSGARVEPKGPDAFSEMSEPDGHPHTFFQWPVRPEALYWGPRFLHERYGLPIMITENGMSCHDWVSLDGRVHDPQRIDYTARYLRCLRRAAREGVPVEGYFHWSLMDNFEWAEGYKHRFGLIHVDFETQQRTLKDSALWYRRVVEANGELPEIIGSGENL